MKFLIWKKKKKICWNVYSKTYKANPSYINEYIHTLEEVVVMHLSDLAIPELL